MNELDKMLAGELYDSSDDTLSTMRADARDITAQYNMTTRDTEK